MLFIFLQVFLDKIFHIDAKNPWISAVFCGFYKKIKIFKKSFKKSLTIEKQCVTIAKLSRKDSE